MTSPGTRPGRAPGSSRCRSSTRSGKPRNGGDPRRGPDRPGCPADHAAGMAAFRRRGPLDPGAVHPGRVARAGRGQTRRPRRGTLEHHSRLVVVQTPAIERIVKRGGDLIRVNRAAFYGRSGLMVSGSARTGKTTAITQLGKTAEVMHRHRYPRARDDIPVIYITVPPAATGKMIAMELARFLGLPVSRRANITDVTEPVCGVCLDARVTMIIELRNLDMGTRAGAEAWDTLKYFSERLPATFVFSELANGRADLPESDIS